MDENWKVVVAAQTETEWLRESMEQTRSAMMKAVEYALKSDNAALHKVAHAWLATYATSDGYGLLDTHLADEYRELSRRIANLETALEMARDVFGDIVNLASIRDADDAETALGEIRYRANIWASPGLEILDE